MILKFLIACAQFYPTQKEDKDWGDIYEERCGF